MIENKKGLLIVISGPSGVGKGTVCKCLEEGNDNLFISISATTRKPRTGEVDGKQYYFYDVEKFQSMIENNQLMEWACFCDNYYGTPKEPVEKMLLEGKDVILEIEPQGAMKIMEQCPDAVFVFLFPPSMEELRNRLCGRGTEAEDVVEKRLERAKQELLMADKYNYYVVNDFIENSKNKIEAIITAEKANKERCKIIF